jgi:hypothetical protein
MSKNPALLRWLDQEKIVTLATLSTEHWILNFVFRCCMKSCGKIPKHLHVGASCIGRNPSSGRKRARVTSIAGPCVGALTVLGSTPGNAHNPHPGAVRYRESSCGPADQVFTSLFALKCRGGSNYNCFSPIY